MGVEPPFLYDKPSNYTFGAPTNRVFNPKAATQASWAPPPPKIKKDGPLIDFNQHPDSYISVPYGNLSVQPMNPNTKDRVRYARRIQLVLRILALIGAIGALFCIITIRKTTSSVGWTIRVGPCVALVHTVYATYHFCRDANSRPPASTASYQIFAGILDTGLIPFFAFSSYMAWADYSTNAYGWDTLFSDDAIDHEIIEAFFLLCAVEGGLFIFSLVVDIYLAVIFRKIAALPPDMNPLAEKDNLTSRPRHKRNKSDLLYEKHLSDSTLAPQRFSQQSNPAVAGRRIPFMHTRTDPADRITLYGSEYTRDSRASLRKEFDAGTQDPYGPRATSSWSAGTLVPSRPGSAVTPSENARQAGAGLNHKPARSSGLAQTSNTERPASWLSYMDYEGMPAELSRGAQQELNQRVRPISPVSAMSEREHPPVRMSFEESDDQYPISNANENLPPGNQNFGLYPLEPTPPKRRSLDPLGMNPPTPVNGFRKQAVQPEYYYQDNYQEKPLPSMPREPLRETDGNSHDDMGRSTPSSRPASFVGSGTKSRFYGNLRTSIGGNEKQYLSHDEMHNMLQRSGTVRTDESGNFEVYGSDSEMDEPIDPSPAVMIGQNHVQEGQWLANARDRYSGQAQQPRQVSNSTGYDLNGGYAGLGSEFGKGMARRREVSGKVAEEGRGYGRYGTTEEQDFGAVNGQTRNGAAGWARFKGL